MSNIRPVSGHHTSSLLEILVAGLAIAALVIVFVVVGNLDRETRKGFSDATVSPATPDGAGDRASQHQASENEEGPSQVPGSCPAEPVAEEPEATNPPEPPQVLVPQALGAIPDFGPTQSVSPIGVQTASGLGYVSPLAENEGQAILAGLAAARLRALARLAAGAAAMPGRPETPNARLIMKDGDEEHCSAFIPHVAPGAWTVRSGGVVMAEMVAGFGARTVGEAVRIEGSRVSEQ
jgi:hypothetical protein